MKANNSLLILFFCFICVIVHAQSPKWALVESFGDGEGIGINSGYGICTDLNKNVYVTGSFSSPTIVLGQYTLTNSGYSNIFVVKYDSLGNVIWALAPIDTGQTDENSGIGICTDGAGNVYVTGSFGNSSLTFGDINLYIQSGIFIAKFDPFGNIIWAKGLGSFNYTIGEGYAVCADANENVYLTGELGGNLILSKFDSSGSELWTKTGVPIGNSGIGGEGISMDFANNIYVTGGFSGTAIFGKDTLLNSSTYSTFFIAKYDSSGKVIWAKSSVGTSQNGGGNISTDISGNSYVTGSFSDTIIFGTDTLTNGGYSNVYIVKYDSSGKVIWAKSAADTGWCWGYAITSDPNGNAYVTGRFINAVAFGHDTLVGNWDYTFVAKYDQFGSVIWAANLSGDGDNFGQGISADASGNVYITGSYTGIVTFGNDSFDSSPGWNVFIAKITCLDTIITVNQPKDFILFPNPSTGNFYFSGMQSGNTIEVYNVLGEMIYSSQATSATCPVSLSGQAIGMYFYKVSDHSSIIRQGKMILE